MGGRGSSKKEGLGVLGPFGGKASNETFCLAGEEEGAIMSENGIGVSGEGKSRLGRIAT